MPRKWVSNIATQLVIDTDRFEGATKFMATEEDTVGGKLINTSHMSAYTSAGLGQGEFRVARSHCQHCFGPKATNGGLPVTSEELWHICTSRRS